MPLVSFSWHFFVYTLDPVQNLTTFGFYGAGQGVDLTKYIAKVAEPLTKSDIHAKISLMLGTDPRNWKMPRGLSSRYFLFAYFYVIPGL